MKKLFALCIATAISIGASAATLLPIQLLNTTGSTSGQAIVSTGASTAPAWGNVSAAALTGLVPVVNGGTGVGTSTGSGSVVLGTSPTITTPNLVGVTNASSAAAGSVGEVITSTAASVSTTSATPLNVTSISLSAGDWDVWGNVQFTAAGSTIITAAGYSSGLGTTSATLPGSPFSSLFNGVALAAGANVTLAPPSRVFNVTTTTTVFLVANVTFTTSTLVTGGYMYARRRH